MLVALGVYAYRPRGRHAPPPAHRRARRNHGHRDDARPWPPHPQDPRRPEGGLPGPDAEEHLDDPGRLGDRGLPPLRGGGGVGRGAPDGAPGPGELRPRALRGRGGGGPSGAP